LVEKLPEFRDDPLRLDALLEQAHPHVGKIIMDSWNFPEDLKLVASDYVNFQRDHSGPADYVDVVQVAFLQSIADTDHPAFLVALTSAPPAFAKLGLQADAKIFEMEGVSEEIELAQSMLL
jgi:HD-like signal output (HDOD) protein